MDVGRTRARILFMYARISTKKGINKSRRLYYIPVVIRWTDKVSCTPCMIYDSKFSIHPTAYICFDRYEKRDVRWDQANYLVNEWGNSGFNWNWLIPTLKTPYASQANNNNICECRMCAVQHIFEMCVCVWLVSFVAIVNGKLHEPGSRHSCARHRKKKLIVAMIWTI